LRQRKLLNLNTHKNYEFFEIILIKICKFFTESLQESDLLIENMKIDKDLFILKFCYDSNLIDIDNFFRICYPEILKFLVNSKNFNLMATEKIKKNIQKDELIELDTNERIEILFYLINSAYDINIIKQYTKNEFFKNNELLKEKSILEFEYKTKENRNKEIEKMEKFQKANQRIKLLEERIVNLEKAPEEIFKSYKDNSNNPLYQNPINSHRIKKDLEMEKERYLSVR
jgi:hypothetical protein